MSPIDAMIRRPEGPPHVGIPLQEFHAALQLIEACTEVSDKRIMSLSVRNNGMVLVKTGEQSGACSGGGYLLLLEKTPEGWSVAESMQWCS
jgi:hypothetical protein